MRPRAGAQWHTSAFSTRRTLAFLPPLLALSADRHDEA
jgi:hypothetical protein